jgi:hypothetical protein
MNQEGNILYNIDEPDIYVLSQFEISTVYEQIFTELRSIGGTDYTEVLLLNLINSKLDDCHLCLRLQNNLVRITREISNSINLLKPMNIPNNVTCLPLTITAKINNFKRVISTKLHWHIEV